MHGEHRGEKYRNPVETRGESGERWSIGVERKAEEHDDEDRKWCDLIERDLGSLLDTEVFARYEEDFSQHGQPPTFHFDRFGLEK